LWRINEKREVGLGFDWASEIRGEGQACGRLYTTLLLWKPSLSIDDLAHDDCS
jgi:hypothetical protein